MNDIVSFTINDKQENMTVGDYKIPIINAITVTASEVV